MNVKIKMKRVSKVFVEEAGSDKQVEFESIEQAKSEIKSQYISDLMESSTLNYRGSLDEPLMAEAEVISFIVNNFVNLTQIINAVENIEVEEV